MDFFRGFVGTKRTSVRDLVRLQVRRDRVLLLINGETARLLGNGICAQTDHDELVRHLARQTTH